MGKFPIRVAVFSFLIVVTAFVCLNSQNNINTSDKNKKLPEVLINYEESTTKDKNAFSDNEEKNTTASTTLSKTKKYILKYNGNEVVLTTCYENGKEISSPIPDINIDYLTDIDRENLIKGIELERKEDVFKLIEDFSS